MRKIPLRHSLSDRSKAAFGLSALAGLVLGALAFAPAVATPGSGFMPSTLSTGTFPAQHAKADKTGTWDLDLKTKDDTLVGVDQLSVAPGGYSGWHSHAGIVILTVTSGTLKWTDGETCKTVIYSQGDSFIEPANHVHYVANGSSSAGASYTGVQLRPAGSPGRIDAAAPYNNCGL